MWLATGSGLKIGNGGHIPKSPDFPQMREHFTTRNVLQDHVQIGIVLRKKHRRIKRSHKLIGTHCDVFAY